MPARVDGKAPGPVSSAGTLTSGAGPASARFTIRYEAVTGRLSYEFAPPAGMTIVSAALRRGAAGPVVAVLVTPSDSAASGDTTLGAAAREAIRAGQLSVNVRTSHGGVLRAPLAFR